MTKPKRILAHKLLVTLAALALFATACGGAGSGGPTSAQSEAAIAAAATNELSLVLTSDVGSTQLLNTADGSIQQLSDVITGDRPVLLWYWAPH